MEKRRIAVIGCSHSAYDQVFYREDNNGKDWVHLMSEKFPNLIFHNYATQGHGPLYYDMVLKYIISELPKDYYDTVIIQYTVPGRWLIPVNAAEMYKDINNSEEFRYDDITSNYVVVRMQPQRIMATNHRSYVFGTDQSDKKSMKYCKMLEDTISAAYTPNGIASMYDRTFYRTFDDIYSHWFNSGFYFDFCDTLGATSPSAENNRSNIGTDVPFQNWVVKTYGIDYLLTDILDDGLHCTEFGNNMLFNDYIMPSLLGTHLSDLNEK